MHNILSWRSQFERLFSERPSNGNSNNYSYKRPNKEEEEEEDEEGLLDFTSRILSSIFDMEQLFEDYDFYYYHDDEEDYDDYADDLDYDESERIKF